MAKQKQNMVRTDGRVANLESRVTVNRLAICLLAIVLGALHAFGCVDAGPDLDDKTRPAAELTAAAVDEWCDYHAADGHCYVSCGYPPRPIHEQPTDCPAGFECVDVERQDGVLGLACLELE